MILKLIDRPRPGLDFLFQPGFLGAEECARLIRCFEANAHRVVKDAPGNKFFDDRYIWFDTIPDEFWAEKRLLQRVRARMIEATRAFYKLQRPLYSDTIQIVKWPPGCAMPAHADNCHPDGGPHNTPWRDYAGVVYLNDDFEGGEFFFEAQKLAVKVSRGMFLAFPGGASHRHGVRQVRRGIRYTVPGWFTSDPAREDWNARLDYESAPPAKVEAS